MKINILSLLFLAISCGLHGQTNQYSISFENAEHHEAEITATFPSLNPGVLSVRMGRSSLGATPYMSLQKRIQF